MIVGLLTSTLKNIATSKRDGNKGALVKTGGKKDKTDSTTNVAKPSSIVVRPKTSIVPKPKASFYKSLAVRPSMATGGGQESYGALAKRLDSVIQNMNTLNLIQKDELNSEKKKDKDTRVESQREQQKAAEEKSEIRSQKKAEKESFKIAGPGSSIFDGAINFLKGFVFSTAIMQLLNWFSDPKKTEKIFKFLEDNFVALMIGAVAAIVLVTSTSLISIGGLLTAAWPIISGALSLLFSPAGLVILGAAAIIAATTLPTAQYQGTKGANAAWASPALKPQQRKAIIESTFGHLPPVQWDPNAVVLYMQALKDLKINYDKAIAALEPKRAAHLKATQQYQASRQQSRPTSGTTILPGLPLTGTLHGQAYGASRKGGRQHAGVDFDIKDNEEFASQIGGIVTKIGYDPNGYGNYIDIYNSDLNKTERIAEGREVLVKEGDQIQPKQVVTRGEGPTGVIHYEIREGKQTTFGFAGTLDPIQFLKSLNLTSSIDRPAPYDMPVASASFIPVPVGGGQQQIPSATGTKFVSIPESGMLNRYYDDNIQSSLYLT